MSYAAARATIRRASVMPPHQVICEELSEGILDGDQLTRLRQASRSLTSGCKTSAHFFSRSVLNPYP